MLEVIGLNWQDAKELSKTNTKQIEYCIHIDKDGLSPTVKELKKTIEVSKLPIRVMLRNHWDTFKINKKQMDHILDFMNKAKELDFDGYVWGAITENNEIDFQNLNLILKSVGNKNITFHKAFDYVDSKIEAAIKLLKNSKVKYILTSGGKGNPLDNLDFFKNFPVEFRDRILIGGGVNLKVIKELRKMGYHNFHIGKLARINNSYENEFNVDLINQIEK